jgi:Skp family chaperone for outer membrane proteins
MTRHCRWSRAAGFAAIGIVIGWTFPGQQSSNAKPARRTEPPRIGYVNIARVVQGFERLNQEEAMIAERIAAFDAKIVEGRSVLAQLNAQYRGTVDTDEKKRLQEQALAVHKRVGDVDDDARKEMAVLNNNKLIGAYEQIREVVAELAKDRGLDVVEAFPAAASPREDRSPKVAQLTIQASALMPLYLNPELDFTTQVIDRLNKKYPPQKDAKPAR